MDEQSTSASSEQLCSLIPQSCHEGEGKVEGAFDPCGVALHVLQIHDEVSGREQLDDVKNGMQGIDNELEGVEEEVRELIEAQLLSAEPLITLESRGTALHRAAERGLERVVARLLAVCPSLIDMVEDWGKLGALHYAALKGHAAIVTQLVAARPDLVDVRTNLGWSTLICAVEHGHPAIVTQLLTLNPSLIDVKVQNSSVLHRATKHPAIMTQLLAIKPSLIDEVSGDGCTALHQAAADGQPAAVAQLLALKPTLIDAVTNFGCTALHLAAAAKTCEPAVVAQLLAANPALIDARDFSGQTALHWAVISGHCEIVAQLLAASPTSIEAKTNNGRSILQLAVTGQCYARRTHEITAQVFAAHPASLEAMINDPDSWTALRYVVGVGDEGAVARVLAMHPDLIHGTAAPYFGWTVFHFAAFYDRPNVISQVVSHVLAAGVSQPELERLLLRRSTKMYEGTTEDSTALRVAALKGHINTITQLLVVCPTLLDADQTCLHAAVNFESTMKYLIDLKPDLIHVVDKRGNTILHSMLRNVREQQNFEFIEGVWKMNPEALHAVNHDGKTPLCYAITSAVQAVMRRPGETAQIFRIVELLQWSLTFDEIVRTYNLETYYHNFFVARLKPLVKKQCGELARELIPDVVAIVFEYLGLKTAWAVENNTPHRTNLSGTLPC